MNKLRKAKLIILFIFIAFRNHAQINYTVETGSLISEGKQTPAWLISNEYGKFSMEKFQYFLSARMNKKTEYSKQFDYGFGLELYDRFDRDKTNHFWLHEGYGELKYRFLRLQAGVREEVFGIHDTTLSSGSFIWSQNARPMPKITLSTPGFIDVPFTLGFVQFKALLSHGWFEYDRYVHRPLLHHKNVYLNIGPKWPVTLTLGMEHFVMWGGESTDPEIGQIPAGWDIYKRIFIGSEIPVDPSSPLWNERNAVGNHLGSYNIGLQVKNIPNYFLFLYWQHPFEDGSGLRFRNGEDGLFGGSIKNKNSEAIFQGFCYELFNSMDHGIEGVYTGEYDADNYFNNFLYMNGWTRFNQIIGHPFIESQIITERAGRYKTQIYNNRILAHYLAVHFNYQTADITLSYIHSKNKGNMYSGLKPPAYQQVILMDVNYNLNTHIHIGGKLVYEWGGFYGENAGVVVMISYGR